MSENQLYVTQSRVTKLKESLSTILTNPDKVTAKGLAQVTGRIISMSVAIGSRVYLHTRHRYYAIESRTSWNPIIFCSPKSMERNISARKLTKLEQHDVSTTSCHHCQMN